MRGRSMDKSLEECLHLIPGSVQAAVNNGHVCGGPFAEYTNDAAAIFRGFTTLISLIQVNQLMRSSGDPDEAEKALDLYGDDSLMLMMRAISNTMNYRAEGLGARAAERAKEAVK